MKSSVPGPPTGGPRTASRRRPSTRPARRTCARRRTARPARRPGCRRPSSASSAGSMRRRSSSSGTCCASISPMRVRVVTGSSVSSRCARERTISPSDQNVIPSPYDGDRPSCQKIGSTRPSRYFWNSQASRLLPMPPWPVTDTSRTRRSRDVAWNRSLSRRSSVSRPTNGASSRSSRPRPRALRDDPDGPPRRHGRDLALEQLLAGLLVRDGDARGPLDRLADEDRAGRRDRLQARCRVHEVARDHALAGRAERHRGLAGEHAAPRLDPRAEGLHRVDEVEARADRPLGVVLVRDRGAPQGHDRVADELLDAAAIARDDVGARARSRSTGAPGPPRGPGPRTAP